MADKTPPLLKTACARCSQVDDHPKHILVKEDGTEERLHFDCHLLAVGEDGCPDICAKFRKGADGLTGAKFREHILKTAKEA